MARFSANLGFLWTELSLPEAIRAAKRAGFDAVECHFPYDVAPEDVRAALAETGLTMLSLNTRPGNMSSGEFGLCGLPGREEEAQAVIDQAVAYASEIGAGAVHVMAGKALGEAARTTFKANLRHAAAVGGAAGVNILIEPLNSRDVPGYLVGSVTQAAALITELELPNLKLLFDCYHVQIIEGDLTVKLEHLLPMIGHVQIAAVPDRGEPDTGEVDYRYIVNFLDGLGYTGFIGAEYKPRGHVEDGLGWLEQLR
ncbi:hydroxypyruvate isomerase family protein [Roseibium sp. RKSG952]|uniref:hydroxypyruvate isomerase family protein n=1 Tax=Roseibium sp. RKSG952 TaxID=2529384 RepID=UPI0012BBCA2C|nr:TIM barrel protein [Roseibium sp. RKSG952]MTH96492.1 isomerase [Roseibium sp. RKSG952]